MPKVIEVLLLFITCLNFHQRISLQCCDVSLHMCRFHAFLLFLGHPIYAVREVSIHRFSKILSEFALEYRTTRERVLQQKQKRANHRERNKTRGKMITDVSGLHRKQHSNVHFLHFLILVFVWFGLYFLNSVKQYELSLGASYILNLVKAPNVAISDRDSITFVMTSVFTCISYCNNNQWVVFSVSYSVAAAGSERPEQTPLCMIKIL